MTSSLPSSQVVAPLLGLGALGVASYLYSRHSSSSSSLPVPDLPKDNTVDPEPRSGSSDVLVRPEQIKGEIRVTKLCVYPIKARQNGTIQNSFSQLTNVHASELQGNLG
jgi:hypothetical protein